MPYPDPINLEAIPFVLATACAVATWPCCLLWNTAGPRLGLRRMETPFEMFVLLLLVAALGALLF